ncbi:MAG: hypothetical protein AAF408_14290, partial [Pseudomonadota bacterium]
VTTYAQVREPAALRTTVEYALRQSSSDFVTLILSGWSYIWIGDHHDAIDCLKKAYVLADKSPWAMSIIGGLSLASLQAGDDESAIKLANDGLNISVGYATLYRVLAAAYAQLGQVQAASSALSSALQLKPEDSVAAIQSRNVFTLQGEANRYITGLRKAGLRETTDPVSDPNYQAASDI